MVINRWRHLGARLSHKLYWNDRACHILNWALCQAAEQRGFNSILRPFLAAPFFFSRGQNSRFSVHGRRVAHWGSVAARCRTKLCSAKPRYHFTLVSSALSFNAEVLIVFFIVIMIIDNAIVIIIIQAESSHRCRTRLCLA